MTEHKHYMKHSMSELRDLPIHYRIDAARSEVELTVQSFDSALIAMFVEHVLPTEHGVVAYADDNDKNELWLTPLPPYRLVVDLAGTPHGARAVKLANTGRGGAVTTVCLEDPAVERKRRCNETAVGAMQALAEADIEAWVIGSVARRDGWSRDTDVDILLWKKTNSVLERHPDVEAIVHRPTWRAPIDIWWAGWHTTSRDEWTACPHLVWDPSRQRLCRRPEEELAAQQRLADQLRRKGGAMKLLVLSDLHLEHGSTFSVPDATDFDVVVLAGDIQTPGTRGVLWAQQENTFGGKPVILVSGNHEAYGQELRQWGRRLDMLDPNHPEIVEPLVRAGERLGDVCRARSDASVRFSAAR